jgi:hypothetical protein
VSQSGRRLSLEPIMTGYWRSRIGMIQVISLIVINVLGGEVNTSE